jgi:thioredoxin 1
MVQYFLGFVFAATTLLVSCSNQQTQTKAITVSDTTLLSAEEFSQKIKKEPNALILDVRTPEEFSEAHIANATNVNWKDNFASGITEINKNQPVLVYCLSGGRSASASDYLRKNGYTQVYELQGGLLKWQASNFEVVADTVTAAQDSGMTLQQFEALLVTDKYVLIDFYATWCGPCKMMEPALEDIAATMSDKVIVVRIDVDKNEELSKHFEVESLPTVQIYKNKKLVWEDIGYKTKKQLVSQLK